MALRERVVAEPPLLHRAGQEVLHEHVCLGEERFHDGAPFGFRQVERQRALAAVDRSEVRGVALRVERRAEEPCLVARGRLHLDHVRAVVGQHLRAERAGEDAGEIDDANAVQGARGHLREGSSTMPEPTTDCSWS